MKKTKQLTQIAILLAVILLMAFTPLGYLKTLGLEITFITIPVIIGAIVVGPGAGALLGFAFGITSFIQCFGMSAFGATLLAINPIFTFITCVATRTLMGYLTGIIFKLIKGDAKSVVPYGVASLCGALLNTLFFMSAIILFFGKSEYILSLQGNLSVIKFVLAFVGINGLVEAIACFLIAAAISKAVVKFIK